MVSPPPRRASRWCSPRLLANAERQRQVVGQTAQPQEQTGVGAVLVRPESREVRLPSEFQDQRSENIKPRLDLCQVGLGGFHWEVVDDRQAFGLQGHYPREITSLDSLEPPFLIKEQIHSTSLVTGENTRSGQ